VIVAGDPFSVKFVEFQHCHVEPCTLEKFKEPSENDYSKNEHNFSGRFCYCDLQFGSEIEEQEMFQCLVCEDWYHEKCICLKSEDFSELICGKCIGLFPFLSTYLEGACIKERNDMSPSTEKFLKANWRELLCQCNFCATFLDSIHLKYILKEEFVYQSEQDKMSSESNQIILI